MRKNPIRLTFSFTAAALLFIVAGSIGYAVNRQVGHRWGRWTAAPIVWEIAVGVGCAVVAAVYWRNAHRALGTHGPRTAQKYVTTAIGSRISTSRVTVRTV